MDSEGSLNYPITMGSQPNCFEVDLAVVIRVALNVVLDNVLKSVLKDLP